MDSAIRALGEKLLVHGAGALSVRERALLLRIANRLAADMEPAPEPPVPFRDRLAEAIAEWAGSWWFIGSLCLLLAFWLEMNSHRHHPFDVFPYPWLNLVLAILAPVQSLIILMSQNRQTRRDRAHAARGYALTLRAAVEVAAIREIAETRPGDVAERLEHIERTLGLVVERLPEPTLMPDLPGDAAATRPG